MYCINCGKKVIEISKFCQNCDKVIAVNKEILDRKRENLSNKSHSPLTEEPKTNMNKEQLSMLEKTYLTTGNLSMFKAVGAFVVAMVVGFKIENVLTDAIVAAILNAPYYYFGWKLKHQGIENLNHALKISKGMLIFSTVFTIFNLLNGFTGLIWSFPIYFYYKSYKETKNVIKDKVNK